MTEDNVVPLHSEDEQYKKMRDGLLSGLLTASEDDLTAVKASVRGVALDPSDRERIIKAVQARHDDLIGVKVPLSALRQEMAGPSRIVRIQTPTAAPSWCKPWVWVANHNKFYNISTNVFASSQTFDMMHGHEVPEQPGVKPKATTYVSARGFVTVVAQPVYLPTETDKLIWVDGVRCVNTFSHDTLPVAADDYSAEGSAYIDTVEAHILMICGDADAALILTQWLAHQVQFPGVKIIWSPLIQSVEGIGKSFFSRLLRCGLGVGNVGVVSPAQLTSTFNGWATNVCVNVLEELKIAGHNRHEALNAVKPLITDDYIQVNPKGVNAYVTPNTANYIAFTNAMDALPLGAADRRWWVQQCPIQHFDEVPDYKNYFPALFAGLREYSDDVCLWLREYPISEAFLNIKQAPMTAAKARMVATEEASVDGLAEAKALLEEGGYLFDIDCVSSADFFAKLKIEHIELDLQTNRRALLLKRLGLQAMSHRVKINGVKKTFWVRRLMTVDEIKAKWPEKPTEVGAF